MRFFLTVLFALGLFLVPLASRAQADAASESARQHFGAGVKLYDSKDYAGALEQFRLAYLDKPSPGIKRNIALCFKELHRYPEAIDTLEQMLAEGGDQLKPEVRDGARRTIDEMMPLVGSLRITVDVHSSVPNLRAPLEVFVDDVPLPLDRLARAVRVMPGPHVVHARAAGFQDATQGVKVDAGVYEMPVTLDLVATVLAGVGRLTVHSSLPEADIAIDGVVLGHGAWSGDVGAGTHHVEVRAKDNPPFVKDVVIQASQVTDVPVDFSPVPAPPPVAPLPAAPPPPERKWYLMGGFTLQGESLTLSQAAFGDAASPGLGNQSRGFGGATLTAKVGRKVGPLFMLEMLGEIGGYGVSSFDFPAGQPARITVTDWVLAPEIRVRSPGNVRFVGGVALGIEGQATDASIYRSATATRATEVSGGSTTGVFLVEAGLQGGVRRTFFELGLLIDVHGIGATDGEGNRLYLASPGVRGGLRLLVGYEL